MVSLGFVSVMLDSKFSLAGEQTVEAFDGKSSLLDEYPSVGNKLAVETNSNSNSYDSAPSPLCLSHEILHEVIKVIDYQ